jgi:hypothetical protein
MFNIQPLQAAQAAVLATQCYTCDNCRAFAEGETIIAWNANRGLVPRKLLDLDSYD